jgi:carbonic anhydrase/acetyltransferase-like protein (isoleucine patch superfamily)
MAIYAFEGKKPKIGRTSYISSEATIIGDVTIGEGCFIGPGARIKGDYGTIVIGDNTSIQENCVLHARPECKTTIGNYVTVGHGAIVHTAEVKDYAVIGMGSIVSDFARIGVWAVVGEGAVVKNNQEIGDACIAVGVPAKVIGKVDEEYKNTWLKFKNIYIGLCERYRNAIVKVERE